MKTLLKLAIAALVLNALYQVGFVYWEHYEFEDAVEKAIQFSSRATEQELSDAVVSLAGDRSIPIDAAGLQVAHGERYVTVDAAYERDVNVLPRYVRTFQFTLHVSVLKLN